MIIKHLAFGFCSIGVIVYYFILMFSYAFWGKQSINTQVVVSLLMAFPLLGIIKILEFLIYKTNERRN